MHLPFAPTPTFDPQAVPREHGGWGADWSTVCETVRIVARADSALAHRLAFHHLQLGAPPSTLRTQVAQLLLANLYLGIAEGSAGFSSSPEAAAAADDPYVQHPFGQCRLLVRPAQALADGAARKLDAAFRRGASLDATERDQVAVAVAAAKLLAHRAAMDRAIAWTRPKHPAPDPTPAPPPARLARPPGRRAW